MRPTVQPTLPGSPVPSDLEAIAAFINREALAVLRALREAVNYESTERKTATTAGAGAYVTVWTSPEMPTDSTWTCRASVAGTDATAGGSQHASYLLGATFQSVAGTVAQVGATSVLYSHESAAGIDARFTVSGQTVLLEARDAGAAAMNFVAVVHTTESVR